MNQQRGRGSSGHDEHFLDRISRLDYDRADLALRLYRDAALIREIVNDSTIVPDADRIALEIANGDAPPYVIVARNGRFVTCLGAGMVPDGLPVLPHERVRMHIERHEARQDTIAVARSTSDEMLASGELRRLVHQLVIAGPNVSREDFLRLKAIEPLIVRGFAPQVFSLLDDLDATGLRVARWPSVRPADAREAQFLWKTFHALQHHLILAAIGGRRSFDWWVGKLRTEGHDAFKDSLLRYLDLREGGLAARMTWVMAMAGKLAVPGLKSALRTGQSLDRIGATVALLAIAVRHRSVRGEVRKTLASIKLQDEESDAQQARAIETMLGDFCEQYLSDDYIKAESVMLDVGSGGDAGSASVDHERLAVLVNTPIDFLHGPTRLRRFLQLLPLIATAEGEYFYLPKAKLDLVGDRYSDERALEIGRLYRTARRAPVRAEARVGRNDPCACGSGKKFKRCCGAPV